MPFLLCPPGWLGAVSVVLDVFTGPYLLFPITFVLPVLFAAWHRSQRWALLLSIALPLLRLVIAVSEEAPGSPSIRIVNMLIRAAVLLILVVVVVRLRRFESLILLAREQDRIAAQVQQQLLPLAAPELEGFDIAGRCEQAQAVGGDYFDYLPLSPGRLGVVVGDVCGHGLGPALLMAATRSYVRALALTRADVADVLTLANRALYEDTGSNRFVTLLLGCIDSHSREFIYASAGHAGYVSRASGAVLKLDSTGTALGVAPDSVIGLGGTIALEYQDIIVLLSDGFAEARSPQGELFGAQGALRIVHANRSLRAPEIIEALFRAVHEFTGHESAQDDITAVVAKAV